MEVGCQRKIHGEVDVFEVGRPILLVEDTITFEQRRVFSRIWKNAAPSKVIAFTWKLLHNRIPTKVNLAQRHALSPEISLNCVMCDGVQETANHLMLH